MSEINLIDFTEEEEETNESQFLIIFNLVKRATLKYNILENKLNEKQKEIDDLYDNYAWQKHILMENIHIEKDKILQFEKKKILNDIQQFKNEQKDNQIKFKKFCDINNKMSENYKKFLWAIEN